MSFPVRIHLRSIGKSKPIRQIMSDPTISPDGKWMWNGSEWIPKTNINQSANIQDSVVMGDVHSTTNHYHSGSLKCNVCGAKGSITILSCSGLNCENMYCNFCQDSIFEKLCGICVELEISTLQEHERKIELARIAEEERRRYWRLLDLEEENKRRALDFAQSRTLAVKIVKARYLLFPLMYLLFLLIIVMIMGSNTFKFTGDIILFGMMQMALTLISYNFSLSFYRKNLRQVFIGKSPLRSRFIAITPILGLLFTIPFFLNGTSGKLVLSTLGVFLLSIYMSAKVTLKT